MAFRLDWRGRAGGIFRLRELIEESEKEFVHDFRKFYGLSVYDMGKTFSYREGIHLTTMLLSLPDSAVAAKKQNWKYPVSREWIVLSHLYDLLFAVNSKKGSKQKQYPNPFGNDSNRLGKTRLPSNKAKELLARMNPKGE